jgi:catechol-2,3-dioxygenase
MVTLNHTNLTTFDVPALTQFFCSVFAFQVTHQRTDKLAVLENAHGFLLTLMYDKQMSAGHGYPGMFHIGFRQPGPADVDAMRRF